MVMNEGNDVERMEFRDINIGFMNSIFDLEKSR